MENNDEYLKKILKEAEADVLEASSKNMLKLLTANSARLQAEAQPPVGYEAKLLKSLKAQLPEPRLEKATQRGGASASLLGDLFGFLKSPQLSWSISGALTLVLVTTAFMLQRGGSLVDSEGVNAEGDILAQTASRGGEKVTGDWLASVGDSGIRAKTSRSLSGLAAELESNQDKAAVDRALTQVAKQMGMHRM